MFDKKLLFFFFCYDVGGNFMQNDDASNDDIMRLTKAHWAKFGDKQNNNINKEQNNQQDEKISGLIDLTITISSGDLTNITCARRGQQSTSYIAIFDKHKIQVNNYKFQQDMNNYCETYAIPKVSTIVSDNTENKDSTKMILTLKQVPVDIIKNTLNQDFVWIHFTTCNSLGKMPIQKQIFDEHFASLCNNQQTQGVNTQSQNPQPEPLILKQQNTTEDNVKTETTPLQMHTGTNPITLRQTQHTSTIDNTNKQTHNNTQNQVVVYRQPQTQQQKQAQPWYKSKWLPWNWFGCCSCDCCETKNDEPSRNLNSSRQNSVSERHSNM